MPSRKKDRGKQRKVAKQSSNVRAPRACIGLSPRARNKLGSGIDELKACGCLIKMRSDGSSSIRHPCFEHIHSKDIANFLDITRKFDRGLLNNDQRKELAQNYLHNYAQDMREGGCQGTEVIARNMADPRLSPQLGDGLLKADIHLSFLHFLNQSDRSVSDVLGRVMDAGDSTNMPFCWVNILHVLVSCDELSVGRDGVRSKVAEGMKPFVMAMMDDKRELFQSNLTWHVCLSSFFNIARGIMMSKEAFLVMISYEGFLPFVAQASCWSQSREDFASESESLRRLYPDPNTSPEPLSSTSHEAQKILALTLHEHRGEVQESVMRRALDQIACTPLLSNNPECNDSVMAGLVRMMNADNGMPELLHSVIKPLLLTYGYVDARVIAELIEYGRSNSSEEAAETVLKLMVAILGQHRDHIRNEFIDSRYAAAVRYGLLEFSIDALVAYENEESDCEIGEDLYCISFGFCLMAMHSKTSRALRERKGGIKTALNALQKKSGTQFEKATTVINDALEASAPAVCCVCLKEVDRKDLLYCKRCGVEGYCSLACQTESYALGHDEFCKDQRLCSVWLRDKGLSETELKRMAVLNRNLMMNGCRLVRSKAADFLDEKEGNITEVTIQFAEYPPDIEVTKSDEGKGSGSLKCTFIVPVYYGFGKKANLEDKECAIQKTIPRRSLAQPDSVASTVIPMLEGLVDHLPETTVPTCDNMKKAVELLGAVLNWEA